MSPFKGLIRRFTRPKAEVEFLLESTEAHRGKPFSGKLVIRAREDFEVKKIRISIISTASYEEYHEDEEGNPEPYYGTDTIWLGGTEILEARNVKFRGGDEAEFEFSINVSTRGYHTVPIVGTPSQDVLATIYIKGRRSITKSKLIKVIPSP